MQNRIRCPIRLVARTKNFLLAETERYGGRMLGGFNCVRKNIKKSVRP